jgi:hypothetical protein
VSRCTPAAIELQRRINHLRLRGVNWRKVLHIKRESASPWKPIPKRVFEWLEVLGEADDDGIVGEEGVACVLDLGDAGWDFGLAGYVCGWWRNGNDLFCVGLRLHTKMQVKTNLCAHDR